MTPGVAVSNSNLLTIRLTAEQRKRLNNAAQREGLATGPWLRSMGLARARYLLDPAPPEYVRERVEGVRKRLAKKAG
jgi:hypothetical protein